MGFNWTLNRTKYLTRREVRLLRKAASKPSALARSAHAGIRFRDWFLIELGLETGLRVCEMSDLVCGDLLLYSESPSLRVRNGKGSKARTIDISNSFAASCETYLRWKARQGDSTSPGAALFPGNCRTVTSHVGLSSGHSNVLQSVQACRNTTPSIA